MSIAGEDITLDSNSSGPATPMGASNPGTPRSLQDDFRNTPPPPVPVAHGLTHSASSSSLQGMVAGTSHSTSNSSLISQVPNSMVNPPPQFSAHAASLAQQPQSKYTQLLSVIEEMGKDIRPTYSSSRMSAERLKRGIVQARILVRECLMECERAART